MVDVINLRRVRKERAKTAREARAAENRVRFGRTKAETDLARARGEKAARDLDAHRRRNEDQVPSEQSD